MMMPVMIIMSVIMMMLINVMIMMMLICWDCIFYSILKFLQDSVKWMMGYRLLPVRVRCSAVRVSPYDYKRKPSSELMMEAEGYPIKLWLRKTSQVHLLAALSPHSTFSSSNLTLRHVYIVKTRLKPEPLLNTTRPLLYSSPACQPILLFSCNFFLPIS